MSLTTNNKIRLFITMEGRLYRDALLYNLVNQKDIDLVGESSTGSETLKLLSASSPSTLIIEENLKDIDGLTISEMALSLYPSLSIILLVDTDITKNRLAIYLDSGIKSVVSKKRSIHELNQAINYTRNGQTYVDVEQYRPQQKTDRSAQIVDNFSSKIFYTLSDREQQVALYIAEHMPLNTIAERLGLSHKTVHTYKERIFVKLGIQRLPELIVFMKRLNFCLAVEGNLS